MFEVSFDGDAQRRALCVFVGYGVTFHTEDPALENMLAASRSFESVCGRDSCCLASPLPVLAPFDEVSSLTAAPSSSSDHGGHGDRDEPPGSIHFDLL